MATLCLFFTVCYQRRLIYGVFLRRGQIYGVLLQREQSYLIENLEVCPSYFQSS